MRILIVEDESTLNRTLQEGLQDFGYQVDVAENFKDAEYFIDIRNYDLVLTDWMLPDGDGLELTKIVKNRSSRTSVVIVSARDDKESEIKALTVGADDYIKKPFKIQILLAQIHANLQQYEQSGDAILKFGPYMFNPTGKLLLTKPDKRIRLTEKETNILKFLYQAKECVVQRDTLLHEIWGYNAGVTTHTLETHIYRLRQKIETDPSNASLLVTENGGYRLAT